MINYWRGQVLGSLCYIACSAHPHSLISGNVGDVFLAGGFYSGLRNSLSRPLAALVATGLASLAEIGQSLHIVHGTYDLKDFLAYGLGVAAAGSIDIIMSRKEEARNLDSFVKEITPHFKPLLREVLQRNEGIKN